MNVWANDVIATINFGNATGSTQIKGNTGSASPYTDTGNDSQGNTWTITTVTSNDKSFTQSATYSQVGSSNKQVTSITFTTTLASSQTIKAFSAKFGGFANTAGDVTLQVGSTSVGSGSLNGTTDVTISATNTTTSGTVLTVTVTNIAKGVKCYYISYTYDDGNTLAIPTTSFSTTSYTITKGDAFDAPTVNTNSDGAITYSSDNDDVATVNPSSGAVTLKGGCGNVTITAETAETATYASSSASYSLKVKGAVEDGIFDFTAYQDYGSGAVPGTSPNTTATTWTAGNVTMDVAGRNVWQNSTSLRLYKASGTDAAGSVTFAAPSGYFITRIVFSGTRAGYFTANNGGMTGSTWTGKSNSVTLTHGGNDAIYLNTATVYYTNAETVSITMGEAGYMTYRYLNANLSFGDGVEAYVASAVGGDNVTLTKVSAAPAGTPLVLKATAGAHNLTIAESAAAVGTNNLQVSNGNTAKGNDVYVLAKPAGKSVGFYKWASATSLSAGKIYLKLPSSSARESLDINFEDDVTAIESVVKTQNIDGQYFDLQGRKVSQPTKGLYIVNGKKVILK